MALAFLATVPASAQQVLLVHLPGAPIEAANQLADAVAGLAGYISREVPELNLQPQLYRRLADADAYLAGPDGANVTAILTEAAFLLDVGGGFTPTHRLQRDGKGTYRRVLIVKADAALEKLTDVQGRSLGVVETTSDGIETFLARAVFAGEVDPATWFSELKMISDDFTATAEVLYGKTEAALVADHNPLLASSMSDLKVVYESPPISLPVLAFRDGTLSASAKAALDAALNGIGGDDSGRNVLEQFRLDGIETLPSGTTVAALAAPAPRAKALAIALPDASVLRLAPLRPPSPGDVSFELEVELPDVPLSVGTTSQKNDNP